MWGRPARKAGRPRHSPKSVYFKYSRLCGESGIDLLSVGDLLPILPKSVYFKDSRLCGESGIDLLSVGDLLPILPKPVYFKYSCLCGKGRSLTPLNLKPLVVFGGKPP